MNTPYTTLQRVTSGYGVTTVADLLGSGPPVLLVSFGTADRMSNVGLTG